MRELRQANTEKGWDKYMKKITGVWIIGILALIVLAGCGQREQGKEIEKKAVNIEEENKTTIGLSLSLIHISVFRKSTGAGKGNIFYPQSSGRTS